MRRLFWAPNTYAKKYGLETIYNFTRICFCLSKPVVAWLRSVSVAFPGHIHLFWGFDKSQISDLVLVVNST